MNSFLDTMIVSCTYQEINYSVHIWILKYMLFNLEWDPTVGITHALLEFYMLSSSMLATRKKSLSFPFPAKLLLETSCSQCRMQKLKYND